MKWLIERMLVEQYDSNKQYASEVRTPPPRSIASHGPQLTKGFARPSSRSSPSCFNKADRTGCNSQTWVASMPSFGFCRCVPQLSFARNESLITDGPFPRLSCTQAYRKVDPQDQEEEEFMENAFDALCSALAEPELKHTFLESEGTELMVICMKEKKMARSRSIKVRSSFPFTWFF